MKRIHSEEWFAKQYRHLPPGDGSPSHRCDGVEESFLRRLARSHGKPSVLDPRVSQVAGCPACLRRLEQIRGERRETARRWKLWGAAFSMAALILVFAIVPRLKRRPPSTEIATVTRTVDLSTSAFTRGGPTEERLATLPPSIASLTLILPALSDPGTYEVSVRKTQGDNVPLIASTGTAREEGHETRLPVVLHLEKLNPGLYYLTTRHGESAAYYYPLEIVR